MRERSDIYRQLLPYSTDVYVNLGSYLLYASPELVQELLETLIRNLGSKVAAQRIGRSLDEAFGVCQSSEVLELLVDFVWSLLPPRERPSPVALSVQASSIGLKFLMKLYPELALDLHLNKRPQGTLGRELALRSLHLWRQHQPLMRRMAQEILARGRVNMATHLELELAGPQARHSMLLLLLMYRYYQLDDTPNLKTETVSAAKVVDCFQEMLEGPARPWILLMLGFADPVPVMRDLSSRHWIINCARHLAAFGEETHLERFIDQLNLDEDVHGLFISKTIQSAITYGRSDNLRLLMRCMISWYPNILVELMSRRLPDMLADVKNKVLKSGWPEMIEQMEEYLHKMNF